MKLFINSGSPYVRKCRILLRETGLDNRVEEVVCVPTDSPPALIANNPLCQLPALVTDTGEALFDSPLICEWIDATLNQGPLRVPQRSHDVEAYWRFRKREATADGIMEMAVKLVLEGRRPEADRSTFWLDRWSTSLKRALPFAEGLSPDPSEIGPDGPDMGLIALVAAATYVDFRFPDIEWKASAPRLTVLQAHLEKRQSFIDTFPK